MIDAATGIVRILKQEGIEWVSTFPVCKVNNALGAEGLPMIMMRDDRYAVAVADAYSRITGGSRIGVCTVQGGLNAAGLQVAYAGLAQAYEDNSPMLCLTDGLAIGMSGFGASAPAGELYEQFGLTARRVADAAIRLAR